MNVRLSQEDVVITVTRLTHSQLQRFIQGALVQPQREGGNYIFQPVDVSRLELLCDLEEALDLDETALGIVVSLIDQLHAARRDLADLSAAIGLLPNDLQSGIMAALRKR